MSLQYVIDGYNIIKHPLLAGINKKSKYARPFLLEFIKNNKLTGSSKNKVTIVFDGFPDIYDGQRHEARGVDIVFSGRASADEKIKRIIESSHNKRNIVVVSDDKQLRFFVRSCGAKVMGIEEFVARKKKLSKKGEELIKPELSHVQMHRINQELKKIWLK